MWSSSLTTKLSQLARRRAIDLAVDLEDHGALVERHARVGVRQLDRRRASPSAVRVEELAPVAAERDVGDDVELLAGVGERALERAVVVRRDDQLVRHARGAQQRRQLGEQAVHRLRLEVAVEERVQLVVAAARCPCHDATTRPARSPARSRAVERRARNVASCCARARAGRRSRDPGAEDRHEPARRRAPAAPPRSRPSRVGGATSARAAAPGAGSRVQLLQLAARLDPELVDERRGAPRGSARAPPPAGPSGRARASAARAAARAAGPTDERLELADDARAWRPSSSSASIRSSSATSRSSSSRAISACANVSSRVGERRAAPERERLAQQAAPRCRARALRAARDEPLEAAEVELVRLDARARSPAAASASTRRRALAAAGRRRSGARSSPSAAAARPRAGRSAARSRRPRSRGAAAA